MTHESTIALAAIDGKWLLGAHVWLVVVLVKLGILFFLGKYLLGLPLRRQENSRLFLDVLALGLRRGQRPEDAFLSLERTGDRTLEVLSTPKSPIVLGIVHLLLGLLGLVTTSVEMFVELTRESVPMWVLSADSTAIVLVAGLVLLISVVYIVAGVQLIRYQVWGRWLAMGLAIAQLGLLLGGLGLLVAGGSGTGAIATLPGVVLPLAFLFVLTQPQVVAVCGRDGKQPPPLVAHLREGMNLLDALRKTRGLVEPRLMALLEVGRELGDLEKILPACRAVLAGATGKVRKAHNYLMVLAFVVTPMSLVILPIMAVYIFPKFKDIMTDMDASMSTAPIFVWLTENFWWIISLHGLLMLALWAGAFLYIGGPRMNQLLSKLAPGLSARLALAVPWQRKRLQRDFSASLALLLDAGLPEPRAVHLAADSTANRVFQSRAAMAIAELKNGATLPEAIRRIDGSGEFRWRLATAARAGQGFLPALRVWHESLDARAFQQEQAAAQLATTSLVFYNGAMVGLVMACVFQFLINLIESVM